MSESTQHDPHCWNHDNIALLKTLWGQGASLTEIARQLGPGFTKGMVAGKRWRLRLPHRPSPLGQAHTKPIQQPPPLPPPLSEREMAALSLPRRNNQCHYLMELRDGPGQPIRYCYCPEDIKRGSRHLFCEVHLSRAKTG